jgi:hypothetical protein
VSRREEGLRHVRKLLLEERRRLEARRAESFRLLGDAIQQLAQEELRFVRTILMPKASDEDDDSDGSGTGGLRRAPVTVEREPRGQ